VLGQVSPVTGKVEIWRIPYEYLTLHEAIGTGSYKSVHRGNFRSHEVREYIPEFHRVLPPVRRLCCTRGRVEGTGDGVNGAVTRQVPRTLL